MKFTVEVEEFWLGEDGELERGLKEYVSKKVLDQIYQTIDKKVEDHIAITIKKEIDNKLYYKINQKISELIATENIFIDKKEISIADHIKNVFQTNTGWRSPQEAIREFAQKFGNECKQRYDLAFASQIVAKMNENGLLKDDVAKLILQEPPQKKS